MKVLYSKRGYGIGDFSCRSWLSARRAGLLPSCSSSISDSMRNERNPLYTTSTLGIFPFPLCCALPLNLVKLSFPLRKFLPEYLHSLSLSLFTCCKRCITDHHCRCKPLQNIIFYIPEVVQHHLFFLYKLYKRVFIIICSVNSAAYNYDINTKYLMLEITIVRAINFNATINFQSIYDANDVQINFERYYCCLTLPANAELRNFLQAAVVSLLQDPTVHAYYR